MDMWEPSIGSSLAHVPGAAQKIVFDRFHITSYLTKAVDLTRRALMPQGQQVHLAAQRRADGSRPANEAAGSALSVQDLRPSPGDQETLRASLGRSSRIDRAQVLYRLVSLGDALSDSGGNRGRSDDQAPLRKHHHVPHIADHQCRRRGSEQQDSDDQVSRSGIPQ